MIGGLFALKQQDNDRRLRYGRMYDSPWTGAPARCIDWSYRILVCALVLMFAVWMSSCGLTGKGGKTEPPKPAEAVEPGSLRVEAVLPLTLEQAAMLEAVNAGLRAGVRGGGKEAGVLADVLWDQQMVAEGVPAAVRGGVRGGVRGFGEPVGLPGAPPRVGVGRRQAVPAGDLGIEISAAVPRSILSPGVHALGIRVRVASRPEMVLASSHLPTEIALGAGTPGTETIVERFVEQGEVQLPDADGDGVSTLMEIVVVQTERGLEEALLMAADPASAPAPEQAERVFIVLQKDLQPFLSKQGIPESFTLAPPDLTAPDTALSAASGQLSVDSGQSIKNGQATTFSFSCNEAFCAYRCSLTGPESFEARPCTSPLVLSLSKDGEFSLVVVAADSFGNADATPARVTFTVLPGCSASAEICDGKDNDCDAEIDEGNVCDTTPPDTALSAVSDQSSVASGRILNQTSLIFTFSSTEADSTFFCQLDVGTPAPCTSPLTLSTVEGSHTYTAYAVDKSGNKDATPATFSWTVDTTPPDTTLVGAGLPALVTNQLSATFSFSSTDTAAVFQCQFDQPGSAGSYATCTSPLALSLSKGNGSYTFSVRAVDPAGNADPTPASYSWTLDTTAPIAALQPSEPNPTASTSISFTLASTDAFAGSTTAATFECSLDSSAFAACTSPKAYSGLTAGSHTFQVQAKDAAGNMGPAASSTWTIDTTPPTFSGVVSATAVSASEIHLAWSAASDNVSASSSIIYKVCMSTTRGSCISTFVTSYTTVAGATSHSITSLSTGSPYYFVVKAVDGANNADGNSTERSAMTWGTFIVQSITNHLGQHTCALTSNGTARCWGDNAYGQLGDGSSASFQTAPVAVTSLTGLLAVAGAKLHTCGLIADGSVKCWGKNDLGQLGDGSTTNRSLPTAVSSLTAAVSVAGGSFFSCGLLSGGTIRCWGSNQYGQLGDGTSNNIRTEPVAVSSLTNAVTVAAGAYHTCALIPDGTVKCWGWNNYGELGDGTYTDKITPIAVSSLSNAVYLSAGNGHTCSLVSDGTVQCWGWNAFGQLGDGTTGTKATSVAVSTLTNVAAVAAGFDHACALISDGSVNCWGSNGFGQVGDGTTVNRTVPVAVSNLTGAVAIAGGLDYTCSLHSDGWVRCWGNNTAGGLGDGSVVEKHTPVTVTMPVGPLGPKPLRVSDGLGAGTPVRMHRKALDGGTNHVCALVSDGSVRCWGDNNVGQLGDGATAIGVGSPVTVTSLTGAIGLAAGNTHGCAVMSSGSVKCWGKNSQGELGDGSTTDKLTPIAVSSLSNVVAVDGGKAHTCALVADGRVRCWGLNAYGQLGDNTTISKSTPVTVTSLTGAVAVEAGGGYYASPSGHTCALIFDGTAKCWGQGGRGALGTGSVADKTTPTAVTSLTGAVAIMAASEHSCALLSDGTAKCWGRNHHGQLGDGTTSTTSVSSPVAVTSLTNAVAMAGGYYHSCALLSNGTVKCWGWNPSGQLGDGTTAQREIPTNVTSLSAAIAIGSGEEHTCAMISDGTIKCWGANNLGQVGDDAYVTRTVPTSVVNFP